MGFYSPHSLVQDARRHGVEVRTPDVNASAALATLAVEGPLAPVSGPGAPLTRAPDSPYNPSGFRHKRLADPAD